MKIDRYETKYHSHIATFPYDIAIIDAIRKIQKAVGWDQLSFYDSGGIKGWVFSMSGLAPRMLLETFSPEMTPEAESDYKAYAAKKDQATPLKLDEPLNRELDVPTLKPLFGFQREAVDFVDKVGGRALIADDMGVGKTAEAIGYAAYKRYGRVLVICPASVKENWKREIKAFTGVDARILTDEEPGGWEILGYSNLEKYFEPYLKKQQYDLVIADESHYIKNKKAKRTKVMLKILKKAKDAIFLTGTPIMNRPLEVYNIFNFITPISFWTFVNRYCGAVETAFGWDYNGATNLKELKDRMWWMIRRTKKEVIDELPDKTINILETTLSDRTEYNKILKDYRKWLIDKDLDTAALYAEALTKVNYLKQTIVAGKNLEEIIDDFLENGKKLIVFSQYKIVINHLYEKYADKAVKLTGDTDVVDRQGIVDSFQKNDAIRIFFSTIKAGGVGITLTEADTVVFTDLDWVPSNHEQAEDRAYRLGQKNSVNVYYLITRGTIEEKIWSMLKRKEKVVDQILSGEENVRKVHIKTLLKNI